MASVKRQAQVSMHLPLYLALPCLLLGIVAVSSDDGKGDSVIVDPGTFNPGVINGASSDANGSMSLQQRLCASGKVCAQKAAKWLVTGLSVSLALALGGFIGDIAYEKAVSHYKGSHYLSPWLDATSTPVPFHIDAPFLWIVWAVFSALLGLIAVYYCCCYVFPGEELPPKKSKKKQRSARARRRGETCRDASKSELQDSSKNDQETISSSESETRQVSV